MKIQCHPENQLLIRLSRAFRHFIHKLTPTTADITLGVPPFVKIVLHSRRKRGRFTRPPGIR
jgi:hypothetical protein